MGAVKEGAVMQKYSVSLDQVEVRYRVGKESLLNFYQHQHGTVPHPLKNSSYSGVMFDRPC